jgi:pimeloyl-ACP methyl ester carboxylesterase
MPLPLSSPSPPPPAPEQTEQRLAQIRLADAGKLTEVMKVQFPRMVHASRRNDEALRRTIFRMAEEAGPEAFVRQQRAIIARPDSRPSLGAIRCPVLVLVGETDEITPPDRAAEIANGIAGARLVILKDCGHLSTLEQPQAVNRSLAALLQA